MKPTRVLDDTDKDTSVAPVQYDITSFGADYDVEGLVRRLRRDDIVVPGFQRDYVWSISEASRFIESLLLGLPVPGIFLARDSITNHLIVIDGQQRLKSLRFFFDGYFDPGDDSRSKRVFRLTKVQKRFEGLTYDELNEDDKRLLNDSIIHATIVKQEKPDDDDTSIYHIFERLNNSGRKLTAQQIRVAIYHGSFIDLIKSLNEYPNWRTIYGKYASSLKDQELILRFLALYYASDDYKRPMSEFLNRFAMWGRRQSEEVLRECEEVFKKTIDIIYDAIGPRAFRPERALNAAVYDSVMVGIAHRLMTSEPIELEEIYSAYTELLNDQVYLDLISQSTSDEKNVEARLELAIEKFSYKELSF